MNIVKVSQIGTMLLLTACSAVPGYNDYQLVTKGYVDQSIKDRISYNDEKALVIRALNCDMSLGAFSRMPEGDVKKGIALICGIHVVQPVGPP